MGLINVASNESVFRGIDYYKKKKVGYYKKLSEFEYKAKVKGNYNEVYDVLMNIEHPRSSKCNCPHANGKRVVCKHIMALYFTVFPLEADRFLKEVEEKQKKYVEYQEELYDKVVKHVNTMTKNELEGALIDILNVAPEWVYDRFVRDYVIEETL